MFTQPQVLRWFAGSEDDYTLKGDVETVCAALVDGVTGLAPAEYQTFEQYLQRCPDEA